MDSKQLSAIALRILASAGGVIGREANALLATLPNYEQPASSRTYHYQKSLSRIRADLRKALGETRPDLDAAYRLQRELMERNDGSAEGHFLSALLYARAAEERRAGRGVPKALEQTTQPLALELSLALSLDGNNPTASRACDRLLDALPGQELEPALKRAGVR